MSQEALKKAEELKLTGDHEQAIKFLEDVLVDDLNISKAYEEIADNFLSLKEFDKAILALEQAIKLDPISANAHYLLGFALSVKGDFDKSITELELADKIEPNHPEILRCLGWSYFNAQDRTTGIIVLERARYMSPNDALILSDLGVCYLNNKAFEKAEEIFNHILEIEPNNQQAFDCMKACQFHKIKSDLDSRK
jgi:tetratricopeptide (TPR) repeat protein